MLLQTVLIGKAQKSYAVLSPEDCADYDIVKATILRNFKLVPEAYRQKFRGYRKSEGHSYIEFMKEKEGLLEKWCESKNVGEEIRTLKQLILMEFLHYVPDDLRIYLNERKIELGDCMAEIADEYAITHKKGKIGCDLLGHARIRLRSNPTNEMREKDNRYAYGERPNVRRENRPMVCYHCGKPDGQSPPR